MMAHEIPASVDELRGLWRRSLMAWPGKPEDRDTWVSWLQGPALYADLRQPAGRPDFTGVTCVRDLGNVHIEWMARQMAFAGTFICEGETFSWGHDIDYGPLSPVADRARLWYEPGRLVERGVEIAFTEHWHREGRHREGDAQEVCSAWRLRGADGRHAILVRAGNYFLIAHSYTGPVYGAATLAASLERVMDMKKRQDMVASEFSFGQVSSRGWLIERSSLPFREGADLSPAFTSHGVTLHELAPEGNPIMSTWTIELSQ